MIFELNFVAVDEFGNEYNRSKHFDVCYSSFFSQEACYVYAFRLAYDYMYNFGMSIKNWSFSLLLE